MEIQKLQDIYGRHPMIRRLGKALARADVRSIRLSGLQGSAAPLFFASFALRCPQQLGAPYLFVMNDEEEAAYFYQDMVQLLGDEQVLYFPSSSFGAKSLNQRGCEVTVYPAHTTAAEIISSNPDGIMLSNGPGDPADCTSIIEEVKKLYNSDIPIFAICLGHQLMALANGAKTYKLKYGHRGGNHPVKDLETGRVYISSQNHGYAVDADSLDPSVAVPAFENVNDKTNEGMAYIGKNIFTVQFHPEACPGPQDSGYLFDRFMKMMGGTK